IADETPPSSELLLLRRRLSAARSRSCRQTAQALLEQRTARLRKDLRVILAAGSADFAAVRARIRDARDDARREGVSAIEALGSAFEPVQLHDVRRKVRRLRYVAEVSAELGSGAADAPKELKKLQEHLGLAHDAYVLGAWLGRQAARAEARGQTSLATEA